MSINFTPDHIKHQLTLQIRLKVRLLEYVSKQIYIKNLYRIKYDRTILRNYDFLGMTWH